jgi:peroxiredoxin
VDEREHALGVWNSVVNHQITILSDPGAQVIKSYGLNHRNAGIDGQDIALDTTLLVDVDGREQWRHVSQTLRDIPTAEETLTRILETPSRPASPK